MLIYRNLKLALFFVLALYTLCWAEPQTGTSPNASVPDGGDGVKGQTDKGEKEGDVQYIQHYGGTVRFLFALPNLDLKLGLVDGDKKYSIHSNTSPDIGIDASYKGFGFGISYRTEPESESIEKRGQTTYRDYQFYYYGEQLGASVFYQDYQGFYVNRCEEADECVKLPDLGMTNYGMNLYYVFSPKFSLKSAFKQTARQRISAGSWLAMIVGDRLSFRDTSPIPPSAWADELGDVAGLIEAELTNLGLGGGYGYTFAGERWYASPILLAGGALQHQRYTDRGGRHSGYRGALTVNVKIAAGYHGDRHLVGVVGLLHSQSSVIDGLELQWFGSMVELYYGFHF